MSASLKRFDRFALSSIVALLFLLGAAGALAQDDIVVSTADPDTTEQGTYDLEVMVGGDNFPSDPEVDFFVTGTEDPGGIAVKKVKRQGPKNLKVTIDVAEEAQFQLRFDIEVRSRSNGRSGKGTELFRVTEKQNPTQDTTPPGAVTVTYVGTSYNEVFLEWIAPADDGYDPASGPAGWYDTKCVEGVVVIDAENWGDELSDGCGVWASTGPASPGTLESVRVVGGLLPNTTYSLAVRVRDDKWNSSDVSNTVTFTTDAFAPDPTWIVQRVPIALDGSLGHTFDPAGNPLILGLHEGHLRILEGRWNPASGQWDWSFEDIAVAADSFALDPFGRPAFGWMKRLNSSRIEVLYTFFDGVEWATEVVETTSIKKKSPVNLTFDPDGNPALAYFKWGSKRSENGVMLARRSDAGQWSIDLVEAEAGAGSETWLGFGLVALAFGPLGSPAVAYSVDLEDVPGDWDTANVVRFAALEGGTWQIEEVDSPEVWEIGMGAGWAIQLRYDAAKSEFAVLHNPQEYPRYCRPASGSWQCAEPFPGEAPDWSYSPPGEGYVSAPVPRWLTIDGFGEAFISYQIHGSIRLARSTDDVTWSHSFVEYVEMRPEHQASPTGINPQGPHLALDSQGRPTLSWIWLRDDWQPGDWTLYFAWKGP